ncbi:hypothetical protein ACH4U6_16395 [Streptomyces netropsis]
MYYYFGLWRDLVPEGGAARPEVAVMNILAEQLRGRLVEHG